MTDPGWGRLQERTAMAEEVRADFNMLFFNHNFTSDSPDLVTKPFNIEGRLDDDDAYLLIQVRGVAATHSIIINDGVLEGGGLLAAPGSTQAWRVGMNHIPPNVLHSGQNTIGIRRFGNDTFEVRWVVVHTGESLCRRTRSIGQQTTALLRSHPR
jgi:hypothetical protein